MKSNSIPEILEIMAVCIAVVIVCPIAIVVFDGASNGMIIVLYRGTIGILLLICVGISVFVRTTLDILVERAIEAFPTITLPMLVGTLLLILLVIVLLILFLAFWLSNEGGHLITFGSCFFFTYIICWWIWSWDRSI